jgi:(+)-trans-carveol dehydrogenase
MGRLEGKVAFITGAARGQGRAHALTMAREGADIIAVDACEQFDRVQYPLATQADLDETAKLVEELDRRVVAVKADVRDSAQMREAADRGAAELGGIDIGVINHGIMIVRGWDEITDEDWDTELGINLTGVWHASRAIVPHMIERGGGSLTMTSSASGKTSSYHLATYVAAKTGVIGLARALAAELAKHWIRVNAICPGNTVSPMLHNQFTADIFNGGPGGTIDGMVFPAQAAHLLPTPWIPADAQAGMALFLASEEGKYITGQALSVDAGMTNLPPGIPPIASTRIAELSQG